MKKYLSIAGLMVCATACGDSNGANNHANHHDNNANNVNNATLEFPSEPGAYAFESRFSAGDNSVAYDGQVARQVLIEDLASFVGGLTASIDDASFTVGGEDSVVAALDFYFRFDSDAYGEEPHGVAADATLQVSYSDISTGKDLVGKLAGNDSATDHQDWTTAFGGWTDASIAQYGGGVDTPENFVLALFEQVEANALARADGVDRFAPDGTTTLPVHVTEDGRDLSQLIQKFLHGAVSFSQGADDYLDDDVDGKGLLAGNAQDADSLHSPVQHAWDEGFGYFGASRYYLDYTDDQVADGEAIDMNEDGAIDLQSEYNFGASTNAAKRDRGAQTAVDLTTETFTAFWNGRYLLATAGDELTDDELTELKGYRDTAVLGWEKALAATVVHYINDTIDATNAIEATDYSFEDHAKVWSEMKGFAMAFQFNPRSPISDAEFVTLHGLLRDGPELTSTGAAAYIADLESARDMLMTAYAFESADVEAW